jgi:hypothetical protein
MSGVRSGLSEDEFIRQFNALGAAKLSKKLGISARSGSRATVVPSRHGSDSPIPLPEHRHRRPTGQAPAAPADRDQNRRRDRRERLPLLARAAERRAPRVREVRPRERAAARLPQRRRDRRHHHLEARPDRVGTAVRRSMAEIETAQERTRRDRQGLHAQDPQDLEPRQPRRAASRPGSPPLRQRVQEAPRHPPAGSLSRCGSRPGRPGSTTTWCIKHRFKGGMHAPQNNTLWAGVTMVTGHLHSQKVTADHRLQRHALGRGHRLRRGRASARRSSITPRTTRSTGARASASSRSTTGSAPAARARDGVGRAVTSSGAASSSTYERSLVYDAPPIVRSGS